MEDEPGESMVGYNLLYASMESETRARSRNMTLV